MSLFSALLSPRGAGSNDGAAASAVPVIPFFGTFKRLKAFQADVAHGPVLLAKGGVCGEGLRKGIGSTGGKGSCCFDGFVSSSLLSFLFPTPGPIQDVLLFLATSSDAKNTYRAVKFNLLLEEVAQR